MNKIEELFKKYYNIIIFNSTSRLGKTEYDELVSYCKENEDDFRLFAKDTLEYPQECCPNVADLCYIILSDEIPTDDTYRIPSFKKIFDYNYCLFGKCNLWLNYFKGTKGIDYYKDYINYKEYLDKHYIGWNPYKEEDPNPTYKEYIKNKEKYK